MLAKELQWDLDIFKDKAWTLPWKLSTTQIPAVRTMGGGKAPQDPDGYGISYIVHEEFLWFHITAFKSSPEASATRFIEALRKALQDMQELCLNDNAIEAGLSQRNFALMRAE
jgi:lipoate-protein ligase A